MRQILVAAALLSLSPAVAAQDEPLPAAVSEAYVAYEEAMQARDYRAAAVAAETAWREADAADIDADLIGVLAANYGELASALGEYGAAYEAWRAAAETADRLGAGAEERAFRWHNAAVAAFAAGDAMDARNCAREADRALRDANWDALPRSVIENHFLVGSRAMVQLGHLRDAADFSLAGIDYLERQDAADTRVYADLRFIRALGSVSRREWLDAALDFSAAESLYPLDADGRAGRDKLIATALLGMTTGQMDRREFRRYVMRRQGESFASPYYWHPQSDEDTRIAAYSPAPRTDLSMWQEGVTGDVVVGYSYAANGEMDAYSVVSSDLPDRYNEYAVSSMDRWWIDVGEGDRPAIAGGEATFRFENGLFQHPASRRPPSVATRQPEYPGRAERDGVEGYGVVRYDIDDDGNAINVEALFSLPVGYFEDASVEAVEDWQFASRLQDDSSPRDGLVVHFVYSFAD